MKRLNKSKWLPTVLICILSLLLFRSFIRSAIPALISNPTTGRAVNNAFTDSFDALDQQFARYGMHFNEALEQPCGTLWYHYYKITVSCLRMRSIGNGDNNSPTPQTLINNWPKIVSELNKGKAQQETWSVDRSETNVVDPRDLFVFKNIDRNRVSLVRHIGKVECAFQIDTDPAYGQYPSAYFIHQGCYRDVKIFGGWDCAKQACKL